jgi:pimeloyl-ACP methyl ester carboxylesterase
MLSSRGLYSRPRSDRRVLRSLALAGLVFLAAGTAACTPPTGSMPLDRLTRCSAAEGPTDALCGHLAVYENRASRAGRQINLNLVVIPAVGRGRPDPLFFLAGGPGQAAAQMATVVRGLFRDVLREHDLVLVDQRGTGQSNPLDCDAKPRTLAELMETTESAVRRLRTCLAHYDADVRLYTTDVAMDDLDDVRAYLGYDTINLYGGSYGTRAALVYLRQHGDRARSVVLDGVAPPDMRLPLYFARDAQRSLDRLVADCQREPGCGATHPMLGERTRALLKRLDATPARVRLVHPRTGLSEEVAVTGRVVATVIVGALYSPVTSALLPELLTRAENNDFQGLFALALAAESDGSISLGMQLSVLCSEDVSRVTQADVDRETAGTPFGLHLAEGPLEACAFWPATSMPDSYYAPVTSDVPTLVLSGEVDPVTPPAWGERVTKHLTRARHVTMASTGHGVIATTCGARLVRDFIDRGSAKDLDVSCAGTQRRPPFFLTPAGPDPAPAHRAAR